MDFTLRARNKLVPSLATSGARDLSSLVHPQNEGWAWKESWPSAGQRALGSTGVVDFSRGQNGKVALISNEYKLKKKNQNVERKKERNRERKKRKTERKEERKEREGKGGHWENKGEFRGASWAIIQGQVKAFLITVFRKQRVLSFPFK